MAEQSDVARNDESGRYEYAPASAQAYLAFDDDGQRLTLTHTEVGDELEGQGVGSALVRAALADAEQRGRTVVPECGFVAGWLERHPDRAAELDIAS